MAGGHDTGSIEDGRREPDDPLSGAAGPLTIGMLCRCYGLGGRPPAPPYLPFFLPFLQWLFFSTGFRVFLRPFCPRMLALER